MKNFIFLLACLALAQTGYSQTVKLGSEKYPEHRFYPLKGQIYNTTYRQIKGDAFLTEDWIIGTIHLNNGRNIPEVKYKFDTYSQIVIIYNDALKRLILPEENLVTGFTFTDGKLNRYFKRVNSDLGVRKVHSDYFLEVLHEGEISFYKLYLKTVLPLRVPEMPFIDEFVDEKHYYLCINGMYEPARLTKSFLKQRFPGYRKEISHYARKNNLRLKDETDFANMIFYLGQYTNQVN